MAASFREMGIAQELCDACLRVGWTEPTPIQQKAIPLALEGRDVIGLAKTGSGKTGAFALPMLQALLVKPKKFFGVVLTPTRELAFQIKDHIQALGTKIGVQVAVLTGGMDIKEERKKLKQSSPHIIVATPGRLMDHIRRTSGFRLDKLQYLVLDEADRMLGVDLEEHMDGILLALPNDRRTMLFSATMCKKVKLLGKTSLRDPVHVKVNEIHQTVDSLEQHMKYVVEQDKLATLIWVLNDLDVHKSNEKSFIIFCSTTLRVLTLHIALTNLSHNCIPIYGKLEQNKRMASINKFKKKERPILVATDVASRGLDIHAVDWVINYDLPLTSKDYIHRVGRTARAGRKGQSLTFTTQYDLLEFVQLEKNLKFDMHEYDVKKDEVELFLPSVTEAEKMAKAEAKSQLENKAHNKVSKKRDHSGAAPRPNKRRKN